MDFACRVDAPRFAESKDDEIRGLVAFPHLDADDSRAGDLELLPTFADDRFAYIGRALETGKIETLDLLTKVEEPFETFPHTETHGCLALI